jgi:hypothetical protein
MNELKIDTKLLKVLDLLHLAKLKLLDERYNLCRIT